MQQILIENYKMLKRLAIRLNMQSQQSEGMHTKAQEQIQFSKDATVGQSQALFSKKV